MQLEVSVRQARLLHELPWVRTLSKLSMEIATEGWRFPSPQETTAADIKPDQEKPARVPQVFAAARCPAKPGSEVRIRPSADAVLFQERLLYLLQPPLETTFQGPQCALPFRPYPYQLEGIAFLMPRRTPCSPTRWGWARRCRPSWRCGCCSRRPDSPGAGRLPQAAGRQLGARTARAGPRTCPSRSSAATRHPAPAWLVSNCPLKLVNYEVLTRDADLLEQRGGLVRRGRPRRGPAHQEPRIEDGPGGPRLCSAPGAGR